MKSSNSEISLYVDTLIVQALLTNDVLVKNAQSSGMISDLIAKVKDYFGSHIKSDDKVGSVINMLAPGVIATTLTALGMPWIGGLIGLAMNFFDIDVAGFLRSAWSKIKELVSGGKQTTSGQIDSAVDDSMSAVNKPATEEEANRAVQSIQQQQQQKSSLQLLRDARLLKLAIIEYQGGFKKEAGILDWFSGKKTVVANLLGEVLKWIIKAAFAAAGLLVAGDLAKRFFDRPGPLSGGSQSGSTQVARYVPKQTKFQVSPTYHEESHDSENGWMENITNNKASIGNMLLGWAKEVYPGLANLDGVIRNTAGFQTLVDTIAWHNQTSEGGPVVFIPKMFSSKKMVVDHFIDEVAEKAP